LDELSRAKNDLNDEEVEARTPKTRSPSGWVYKAGVPIGRMRSMQQWIYHHELPIPSEQDMATVESRNTDSLRPTHEGFSRVIRRRL